MEAFINAEIHGNLLYGVEFLRNWLKLFSDECSSLTSFQMSKDDIDGGSRTAMGFPGNGGRS